MHVVTIELDIPFLECSIEKLIRSYRYKSDSVALPNCHEGRYRDNVTILNMSLIVNLAISST